MTEDDALLFRAFRENQENFSILYGSGVFNIRSGSATLHFNLEGVLDAVDADVPTYRKGHKQLQFVSVAGLHHENEVMERVKAGTRG